MKKSHNLAKIIKGITVAITTGFGIALLFKNKKQLKKTVKSVQKTARKQTKQTKKQVAKAKQQLYQRFSYGLKDFFIPHEGNNHHPKGLRPKALVAYVAIILVLKIVVTGTLFFLYPNYARLSGSITDTLYQLTNEERIEKGLPALTYNAELERAAQAKVQDMIANNYFDHIGPDGTLPWEWIDQNAYSFSHMGENLAMDFSSAKIVHSAFLQSPSHRKNVLHDKYTDIGIAMAAGSINGRETFVLAEFFGTPKAGTQIAVATEPAVLEVAPEEIVAQIPEPEVVPNQLPVEEIPEEFIIPEPVEESIQSEEVAVEPEQTEQAEATEAQQEEQQGETQEVTPPEPIESQSEATEITDSETIIAQETSGRIIVTDEQAEDSTTTTSTLATVEPEPTVLSSAQLVVSEAKGAERGLVDLLVSWTRNFTLLMLVLVSFLLLTNVIIKTHIQHARVIVHSLVVIAILAAVLFTRIHMIEKFIA